MSGFSACPMCGQSIHAHDPGVCRRRWQADTVAAAERFAAELPPAKPRPFAKTYDCESADTDAGHVVVALALSARDAANLRALADGAAIITGEVTIEATATGFVVQLDNYTVFA